MKDGERSLPLIPFSHSFSSRAAESSISMKYESSVAAGILQQQCRRTTLSPGSSLPFRLSSDNFPPFELLAREEKQKGPNGPEMELKTKYKLNCILEISLEFTAFFQYLLLN